jgi:hypothetical protein
VGRGRDVLACFLITLSVLTIEVGIALLVGIAVLVALRRDRWRRAWIVIVPAAIYVVWWAWARKFDQEQSAIELANLDLIPETVFHSAAIVFGALTGTNPIIPGTYITPITWFGKGLAVLGAIAIIVRLRLGAIPRALWAWLALLLFYWVTMGLAARPPEGSRYVFFGAVAVLLVAAEAFSGRIGKRVTAAVFVIVALALPANIAQLRSGHETDVLHHDAGISRAEFAMLELAGDRVDPEYVASSDPNVAAIGGGLFIGVPAGAYLDSVERNGSPAFTLEELRNQPEELRKIADVTLASAIGLEANVIQPPSGVASCRVISPAEGQATTSFPLPAGETAYGAAGEQAVTIGLRRFADAQSGTLEEVPPGAWRQLEIPADAAPEQWQAVIDAPLRVCADH